MSENNDGGKPPEGQNPEGGAGDGGKETEAEEKFWKKFDEKLSAGIDKKLKEIFPKGSPATGSSRTGGRTTVPRILADFMFGPDKT